MPERLSLSMQQQNKGAELYVPNDLQREMHESRAKNKVLEWARRRGKSRSALFELISTFQYALTLPAPHSLQPPFLAWIVAPTFPQAGQVWTELNAFIPQEWIRRIQQDWLRIELFGNENRPWGLIEVKSAHDPNNLQTAGLDFLWVTEAQEIEDRAFQRMRPMLISPDRLNLAIWEGIPALYPDHWFWKICDYAKDEAHTNYYYSTGTAFENPFLTDEQLEEIEEDRSLMPEAAWRRMYLAERSESAGFFKNIDACTVGDILFDPLPGDTYVAGLDLGRKSDPSVLYVGNAASRQVVYRETWDQGEDWAIQRESITSICNLFGVQSLWVDATGMGGDIFSEALEEAGLPVERYDIYGQRVGGELQGSRMELLNNLAVSMERETVHFPFIPTLNRQLRAFQFIRRGGGKPRPDHPEGEHDDEIFALGLMLLACDPATPQSVGLRGRISRMSYLPSSSGYAGGSEGIRMMHEAREQRMRERMERSGIET